MHHIDIGFYQIDSHAMIAAFYYFFVAVAIHLTRSAVRSVVRPFDLHHTPIASVQSIEVYMSQIRI